MNARFVAVADPLVRTQTGALTGPHPQRADKVRRMVTKGQRMNFFLTGGTGNIGKAVLEQAINAGHTVTALARSDASADALAVAGVTPVPGDLATPEAWMPLATQADCFIHLANSFDDRMAFTEPQLIESLAAQTAHRTSPLRLLYTGGCWLYGATHNGVAHESSPFNPPVAFRWAADAQQMLATLPGLACAVIHPAMVYDEQGGVFSRYLKALRQGRPPAIWGSKSTRWPLVHRADAAAAYLLLAADDQTGAFNIVAEQGVPAEDITDILRTQAGIKAPAAVLPEKWVLSRHGPGAHGPMLDQQMRSTRMGDLGWQPAYPDFRTLTYAI